MTPEELRADIPALDDVVYLNTGAGSPSPRRVVEAAEDALEHHEYEAPAAEGTYAGLFEAVESARAAVAGHLGTDPETVALTQSTADGISRVAAAMDWGPGDVVVRTDQEHPSGVLPFQRLEHRDDVEVRVVPVRDGRVDREAFADAVDGATLAAFSSLCWTDGTRLPVAELTDVAHDAGARVMVDAVQSVGHHPVDVTEWGADAVAGAGHKWALGPTGAGFLYVDSAFAQTLDPAQVSYRSVEDPHADPATLYPDARRLEVGSVSPVPHAGLAEGLAILEELGYDTVTDHVERLTDRLKAGLPADRLASPRPFESGLVAVRDDDPAATVERLAEEGIRIRDIPGTGCLRVSIHVFNTAADVDAVLGALGEA